MPKINLALVHWDMCAQSELRLAGDAIPDDCRVIEVRVAELRQLFHSNDPSPFRERDLDPAAERFIVDWSRELPVDARLALVVYLERDAGRADEAVILREAIREFFGQREIAARRTLRELFRRGRISLAIGLAFLTSFIVVGDWVAGFFAESRLGQVFREGLLIGGWVAMWRPIEVFLYDWWPIRAEARLFSRLSSMPVRIEYMGRAPSGAWRRDWPAVPAGAGHAPETVTVRPEAPDLHDHTPEEERKIREAALDQTIENSFPASDPPSSDPNPDDHTAVVGKVPRGND
ncbi:MAG TPA: hypothetical protein VFO21_14855 [Vicinamibacterales bacterium]|nr:hypothetical protein [Vicinamibacterales bacterium]